MPQAPTPRILLPPSTTTPTLTPSLRSSISAALLTTNTVPSIHAALLHECQASGWLDLIKARTLDLLRSGQCATFSETMNIIMNEIKYGTMGAVGTSNGFDVKRENGTRGGKNGVTTNGDGGEERVDLRVPPRVIDEGIKIVRGVLETLVDIEGAEEGVERG